MLATRVDIPENLDEVKLYSANKNCLKTHLNPLSSTLVQPNPFKRLKRADMLLRKDGAVAPTVRLIADYKCKKIMILINCYTFYVKVVLLNLCL